MTVRLILDLSKSGPYTEGCDGKIIGGDSGEMGSGSKLNIPSGVPSETCPSESFEGDVLGVVKFGLVGWGVAIFGCEMGDFYNCGGYDGGGICCCCSVTVLETKGVSMIGVIKVD